MESWLWLAVNGALGVPLALVGWSVSRELVRSLVALILGFRVFEVRLGVGRAVFRGPIGPIDLSLASIPMGGASGVRSGSPRRHRLRRLVCALVPSVLTLGWLAARSFGGQTGFGLPAGPDPWAILDLTGLALLAFHLLIPAELPGGVRTDSRLVLDALLERADGSRAARASYYARLARHHLERGRTEDARAAIERGAVQLGPEPLLLACRAKLASAEIESVVDQGDCADRLQRLIEEAEAPRALERHRWGLRERGLQTLASALPLTIALGGLGIVRAEPLLEGFEARLLESSDSTALSADHEACSAKIGEWSRWSRLDRLRDIDAPTRRDRHDRLARLEACRKDIRAAALQREAARAAALEAGEQLTPHLATATSAWLENEIFLVRDRMAEASRSHSRRAHREALSALSRAEQRATAAKRQLDATGANEAIAAGANRIDSIRAEVQALRERLIEEMSSTAASARP